MKTPLIITSFVVLLSACSIQPKPTTSDAKNTTSSQSAIQPIEGLEIPIRNFEVSASTPSSIQLPNGGEISFPANAFVDETGKPVKGKVTIEWQEYHSLTDILLSGIPMAYDSAGISSELISGGMFTIDAHQGKTGIELAPGKSATVALASNNPQKAFNFYALDETTGKWSYETTAVATPNPAAIPGLPVKGEPKEKMILLDVEVAINKDSFPELNPHDIIGWEIPESAVSKKQMKAIRSVACKANIQSKLNKDKYSISISNPKETIVVAARPVTFEQGPSNQAAAKKQLNQDLADYLSYQDLASKGELIRSIEIPNFGTYNWDCMYHNPNAIMAQVKLDIPNTTAEKYAHFYFVCPEANRVIPMEYKGQIVLDPKEPTCIIGITKEREVFAVRNNQFNDIRDRKRQPEYHYTMKPLNKRIQSGNELSELIQQCI